MEKMDYQYKHLLHISYQRHKNRKKKKTEKIELDRYFVSFAGRIEEIVKCDDIRMIQQPHHL